jgi:hypothetical protein
MRTLAQLAQLLTEHFSADSVAAVLWLVVGERELAILRERRRRSHRKCCAEQNSARKRQIP